ncbi:MAG: hypothetical protein AB3N20_20120 [Rhizobiaceae bacterium]
MRNGLGMIGAVFACATLLAGCTSISSNYSGEITETKSTRIFVCHGFDCSYKTKYTVTPEDLSRFAEIMSSGAESAEAERKAIVAANMYYEERAAQAIGVRDKAKSHIGQSRERGQMDCIDESTNTRSMLLFLEENGWLKHHKTQWNVSRGVLIDGRYFHSTAVIKENANGKKWAVDSWFEPTGVAPDIVPLSYWKTRGIFGQR